MEVKDITIAGAQGNVPPVMHEVLNPDEKKSLKAEIKSLLVEKDAVLVAHYYTCLLYTSPSPRDLSTSRMPSSA